MLDNRAFDNMTLPVLSMIICGGYLAIALYLVAHQTEAMSSSAKDVLDTLKTAFILVVGFYFGSSLGSRQKDGGK